jgi:hypothetical protein
MKICKKTRLDFHRKHPPRRPPYFEGALKIGTLLDDESLICVQNQIEICNKIKNRRGTKLKRSLPAIVKKHESRSIPSQANREVAHHCRHEIKICDKNYMGIHCWITLGSSAHEVSKENFPPKHQPWKPPFFEGAPEIGTLLDDGFVICVQNHIGIRNQIKNRRGTKWKRSVGWKGSGNQVTNLKFASALGNWHTFRPRIRIRHWISTRNPVSNRKSKGY